MPNNTVYVCPDRDIECGRNPKSWCPECPQWKEHKEKTADGCSVCGIQGWHACSGAVFRKPSKEDLQRPTQQLAAGPLPQVEGFRFVADPYLKPNEVRLVYPNVPTSSKRAEDVLTMTHIEVIRKRLNEPQASSIFYKDPLRVAAFEMIRDLLNAPNQDDVLTKIRLIVNNCP